MDTPLPVFRSPVRLPRPSLRAVTIAALVLNALVFGTDLFANGPNERNLGHIIPPLVGAGLVAIRRRWMPALGALLGALWLLNGAIFLTSLLVQPDGAATFAFAALIFANTLAALVAGVAATVQHYRAPRTRPGVDPPAPAWFAPALLAFAALILGGIATTALQPRAELPGVTPEALAALPGLTTRDYQFDRTTITARVGEPVALRLDNRVADPGTLTFHGMHVVVSLRTIEVMVPSRL